MNKRRDRSDDDLMRAFQGGEVEAFEALVARYQKPLAVFVHSRTAESATTDDIVQETFIRVYEHHRDYIPSGRFRAWVYAIARNLCCDKSREPTFRSFDLDMPVLLWSGLRPVSHGPGIDEGAGDSERLERVSQAAELLRPLMREAVILRYYHGLKLAEIAEVQDCPVGTVKSRLHYAVRRMKKSLSSW